MTYWADRSLTYSVIIGFDGVHIPEVRVSNPGGSIKDRAAKQLIEDAMERGELKPGMTVVEGLRGIPALAWLWLLRLTG